MRIIVVEPGLGRFEWEVPKALSDLIQQTDAMAPGMEAVIADELRDMIRGYLHLLLGAMLCPLAAPAIIEIIRRGMDNAAKESMRALEDLQL